VKQKKHSLYKSNKGNFSATLTKFNQNLNYEKIYVFLNANIEVKFYLTNILSVFLPENDVFSIY